MSFLAIDRNVKAEWFGKLAGWDFDLICARSNESDFDFIERALTFGAIGFLSNDTDIPSLLLSKFKIDIPVANTPETLKKLLFPRSKEDIEARRYRGGQ